MYRVGMVRLSKERKHKSDAQRLREYLRLAGLSQIEAARQWDISERTMRYYCSGRYPVPKVIMLLAEHTARRRPIA
jgi:DNA-binding XRE family transcriptional regulator